jgi:hypothetical protein
MPAFSIGNLNNPPLNNVDGNYVNKYGTTESNIVFSNTVVPTGSHTISCMKGGSKYNRRTINRNRINKISRRYKMKGSRKSVKRRIRRIKSRMRSKTRRHSSRRRRHHMKGGAFQPPMSVPNYPAGHSQYNNNNGSLSNTYSLGGPLSASNSALANPPPYKLVENASVPDNLNHNTVNSYGNIGSGSGFVSRGSF